MNTYLGGIKNWARLATKANWSASALARNCHVSLRTLERYFIKELDQSPKKWLKEQRQREGLRLLREGSGVKQVAALLGYSHANQFSRDFKEHWGFTPSDASQPQTIEKRT